MSRAVWWSKKKNDKEMYSNKKADVILVVPLTDNSSLFWVSPPLSLGFRRDVVRFWIQGHPSSAVDDILSNIRVPLLDSVECGRQSIFFCFESSPGVIKIHTRQLHFAANASDAVDELLSVLLVHYPGLQQTLLRGYSCR